MLKASMKTVHASENLNSIGDTGSIFSGDCNFETKNDAGDMSGFIPVVLSNST